MNKNTEITTTNNAGYLALRDWNLSDVMAEEMSGLSVSLEKIRIPHGGPNFVIPGDDPDAPDAVKEFTAVILYQHPLNAFYKEVYHGGSNPPDCGSYDGVYGTAIPAARAAIVRTTCSAPATTARKRARTADGCICCGRRDISTDPFALDRLPEKLHPLPHAHPAEIQEFQRRGHAAHDEDGNQPHRARLFAGAVRRRSCP